ncbi:hypothetical protein ACFL34_02535 [Candidatus Sumerlaeota bacterium]
MPVELPTSSANGLRCLLTALLLSVMLQALAAETWLREETLTYEGGSEFPLVLAGEERAGEFFNAPAGFNRIALQVHYAFGWSTRLDFVLYGPFATDELPDNYTRRSIVKRTLHTISDKTWRQVEFPPQAAGRYFWEISNPETRAKVGCYARRAGDSPLGYAVVKGQAQHWVDLKSTIAYTKKDRPLPLPVAATSATTDTMTAAAHEPFLGSVYSLPAPSGKSANELALLRRGGWRSLLVPWRPEPDFWTKAQRLKTAAGLPDVIVGLPHWDDQALREMTAPAGARGSRRTLERGRIGDLSSEDFVRRSREALATLVARATEQGFDGPLQLLGPLAIDPGQNQQLADWLATMAGAIADRPDAPELLVSLGSLERLDLLPPGIGRVLVRPADGRQLDILSRLHDAKGRPAPYVLEPLAADASPEDLERLRWLICRNLERPLGYCLADFNNYQAPRPGDLRRPATGLVDARVSARGRLDDPAGELVRLKRQVRALAEFAPLLTQSSPPPAAGVLIIAADLAQAPFLAKADYVSQARFLRDEAFSLKPYQAVVLSATGDPVDDSPLLARLEKYVKRGGCVVLAPSRAAADGPLPEPDTQVVFSDSFDNTERSLKAMLMHSINAGGRLESQNGLLGVSPKGAHAELLYAIRLPADASRAWLDVRYRCWDPRDWFYLIWSADGRDYTDTRAPRTPKTSNELSRVFDIKQELKYDTLYLQFILRANDPARPAGDFGGAALDQLEVTVSKDPLHGRRQVELADLTVLLPGIKPYLPVPDKGHRPVGAVKSHAGVEYPAALVRRQRFGKWIIVNVPELLTNSGPTTARMLEQLLAAQVKGLRPTSRAAWLEADGQADVGVRLVTGEGWMALTKDNDIDEAAGLTVVCRTRAANNVVFDYFAKRPVEHTQGKNELRFKAALRGPDAANLYLIKPAPGPARM